MALGGFCLFALGHPAGVRAGLYTVDACTETAHPGEGLSYESTTDVQGIETTECGAGTFGSRFGIGLSLPGRNPAKGFIGWRFAAPADTKLHRILFRREIGSSESGNSNLIWSLTAAGNPTPLDQFKDDGTPTPPNANVAYVVDAGSVTSAVGCASGCGGSSFVAIFLEVRGELEDSIPPTLAQVTGSLVAPGPLRGVTGVTVHATDRGSGVAGVRLFVDGLEKDAASDPNGGHCVKPFVHVVPCRLNLDLGLQLNTALLSEGQHNVQLLVTDAAGESAAKSFQITVRNAPVNLSPPALSGSATLGGGVMTSEGTWEGEFGEVLYQWLRCPAQLGGDGASGCTPILGATKPTYFPGPADVYGRLLVRVTGSNSHGEDTAVSAPSEIVPDAEGHTQPPPPSPPKKEDKADTTAPRLSKASLSRRRFRLGKVSGRRGSVLRFSSSEAAQLTLTVKGLGSRRRVRPLSVTRTIGAGSARLPLTGRFGRRRLLPGAYRLTLTARDAAGNVSGPAQVRFTILPG